MAIFVSQGSSAGKESACNAGGPGLISGSESSPGGRIGYPLQYSCLKNPHGQRSLVGSSPLGRKESDMIPRDLYLVSFLVAAIEICNGKLKLF